MFVDFNKAFDSLYHAEIWVTLAKQRVPRKFIEILINIYSNSEIQIKLDKMGDRFLVKREVKQGDPLSPNIFNAVLEDVFRQLNWGGKGLKISGINFNTSKNINNLRFADNIGLIAENSKELEEMARELWKESNKVGLLINFLRTKITTNIRPFEEIKTENKIIEIVKEYKYLGQIMSFEGKTEKEVRIRRANAWKVFWGQKYILKGKVK